MSNDTDSFETDFATKSDGFGGNFVNKTPETVAAMAEMEYQLGLDYAPAWRPENDGDSILGVISAIAMGHSEFGTYPIITILTGDGEMLAVHGFHSILKQRLIEIRPAVDEILGIKYLGHVLPEDGTKNINDYYAYKVLINRPANDIWDKFPTQESAK